MSTPFPTGWRHDPAEVSRALATLPLPFFASAAPDITGSGAGKTVLLYKAFKEVNGGRYMDYPAQVIGCCVGRAHAAGVDLLGAVEIAMGRQPETFKRTSHEAIYGMARIDIGKERGSYEDGAVGAWAAKAVSTLGTISQEAVGPLDDRRAKEWGATGVPARFKEAAKEHPVGATSLIRTYSDLEDAIANGYPVTVCSFQGFTNRRDAQGFCQPEGEWAHCMMICGVRNDNRPGACIFNSWGMNVPSGPLALDQPPNSFWADRAVVDRMLAMRDSWSLSNFQGYPSKVIPSRWTYEGFA